MKYRKKAIRKPVDFNLNCMTVVCGNEGGIKYIDLYINGTFEYDFYKVKKFHDALGKALEWVDIEKTEIETVE